MQDSRLTAWTLNIALTLILVFMLAPIVIVIINSFNASQFNSWPPTGFTLDWYRKVLADPNFRRGTVNSIIFGLISTAVVLVLGTLIAYALARIRISGLAVVKSVLFSPLVVPRVAIGFALFVLFISMGIKLYGTAAGVVLAHSILMLPFVVAILTASFGEVDPIVEEAARDLGAMPFQAFRLAVLPQIRPGLIVAGIFAFITSFDEVEVTLFVVRPAVNTLPVEMYFYLEQYQDPTIAALSTLLIAFSLAAAMIVPFLVRGSTLLKFFASERQG